MTLTNKDLTAEKIKLIYEFNNNSPLFARVAFNIVEQGNINEAISILEKGLEIHKDYPTAFLILSLAFAYAGKPEEARTSARKASEIMDSHEVMDYYFRKIDNITKERNSLAKTKITDFSEPDKIKDEQTKNIEDQLETLAKKLTSAKINYDPEDNSPQKNSVEEFKGEKIASETLAGIYLTQKKYREAISVYTEMVKKNPNRADELALKIAEIQNIIDDESGITLI